GTTQTALAAGGAPRYTMADDRRASPTTHARAGSRLRLARGEPAVLPALSGGEAGAQASAPGAARWREARVRLPPVRDAVREQGRAPPASRGPVSKHAHSGHAARRVTCAVVTVSDTRTEATDTSGRRMRELLEAAG